MRADEGKSVQEMEFLAPVTPAKPMVLGQRQIYQNGQEILSNQGSLGEAGAYRAQVSLVSKMGGTNHYQTGIGDEANQADRWTPLYSATTRLSGSTSDNNSVHGSLPFGCGYDTSQEMNAAPKVKESDPFTQWNHMPFCDLLAMNNGGAPVVLGGSMNPLISNDFFVNLNPQTSFMFENQGIMGGVENILVEPNKTSRDLQGSNQQLNERIEIQQSGYSRNSWNSYDLNALPNAENELQYDDRYADIVNAVPDGGIHVFAPETPDHFKRLGNDAPGKIAFPADKQPSKQGENDNQVSIPVVDNWLGISEIRSPANSIAIESHSPEKGCELDLEQNKTPQPKARRKKHRPKVVREVKPKQTPTQKQPKANNTNETPTTQKRKYVRKNKTKTPSTTSPTREGLSSKVPDRVVRSCRKTLNFDLEEQVKENNSSHRSSDAPSSEQLPLNQEGKDEMEATREYDAYDISVRNNQILKDYMSMPEGRARDVSQATFPLYESNAAREYERGIKRDRQTSTSSKRNSAETCASSIGGEQTRGAKRANLSLGDASNMARGSFTSQGTPSEVNHMYLRSAILNGIHGMYFPEIFKKRRTEKVLKPNTLSCASTSKYYYLNPAPHFNVTAEPSNQATTTFHSHEDKTHFINWANIDKLKQKKKRSKVPTRVRELDSLKGFAECRTRRSTSKQKVKRTGKKNVEKFSHRSSMEVVPLVSSANRTGKRQSRKRSTKVKSVTSSYDLVNKLSLELHKDEQLTGNANGPFLALPWKDSFSVDAIIEGMEQLNINKQGSSSVRFKDQNILVPYHFKKHFQNQQQNALVLYQRDRSMIPFEGTQASKRRSRARVDLDDETSRVWKLLLEDINSQGIDGTDEEKAKWWENERKVFCGRVDSFIARMRLVQGDRHFSPWKGSVVDSVVGVFLTQNVSDHLSSSAFMSVAARFPVNPTDKFRMHPEEEIGPLVEEPESFIVDLNDNGESLEWNEKTVAVPSCDRNSRILHDTDVSEESHGSTNLKDETWCCFNSSQEKPHESILYRASSISKESEIVSASADARRIDDVSSSQLSVISCQNSVESPNALMGSNISSREDMTACSKPSSLNCSGSFVELLRMAGTPKLDATYVSKDQMPSYKSDVPNEEGIKDEHIKKPDTTQMLESFSNVQSKCSTVYELHATEGYILQGVDEESRSVSSTKSSQDFTTEQIKPTESTSECLLQEKASESNLMSSPIVDNVCSCYVLDGEDMIILTPRQPVETQQDMIIQTPRQPIEIQQDTIIQTPMQPVEMQQDTIIQTPRQPVEMQQDTIIQTPRQPVEMQQDTIIQTPRQPVEMPQDTIIQTPAHPVEMQQDINSQTEGSESSPKRNPNLPALSGETGVTESTCASNITVHNEFTPNPPLSGHNHTSGETHHAVRKDTLQQKTRKAPKKASYDWENLRKEAQVNGKSRQQTANTMDSVDWEAVRRADVNEVAKTIKERGMNNVLAVRIKEFLDRIVNDHGSIDLEWLRDVPPDKAKEYLLSIRGLGLKSVECVRLLTLHQLAFPVDTNVGRIAVRLGWVPLQPLPESLQLHLLELYPILESIQKYLWPRLCKLDQKTLYELHYHLITFGKVFCTKKQPNCNACPLRGECRHFASAFASARLALPAPEDKRIVPSYEDNVIPRVPEDKRIIPSYEDNAIPQVAIQSLPMPLLMADPMSETKSESRNSEPIVEIPASPEAEPEQLQTLEYDIEDALDEDPNEIPTIKLNLEQFTNTLQTYMQSNMELQDGEMSTALVSLATEAASIPTPRLKNVNRLRTEHHVYELPDTHQLLRGLDKREPDDPCSYLLAIWTPGETANSIEAPEKKCNSQEPGELCGDETCFYCNSQREANSQIVRGTLLIPCRTAMRGSFPLNGTYFQVNEVFADHDSSLNPIEVPRQWIWNLPRRTVYFGTSIPSIFKGLSTEGIQHCFWRGYVCVRGFEQKTRSPRPLMARLHFPASKLARPRGRNSEQDV